MKPTTLDDLLSIWEDRKEAGTPLSPEQLCSECPELLEEFRWHVKALEAVESRFGLSTDNIAVSTPGHGGNCAEQPPTVVRMSSEFVVEKLYASGGLGAVYLAHDPVLKRRVALKFPRQIRQSSAARARFEREAHITSQLDHPGVVPVHAISTNDRGPLCYATRFVEGMTLRDAIRQFHESAALTTGVEFRQLLQRFVTVCNIVAYAHDRRIIHRDIKPANILLGAFGETLLIDWGLAKVLGESPEDNLPEPVLVNRSDRESHDDITVPGQLMGTPAYASPEQLFGRTAEVAEASDVYSLGATLFTMLTGQTLFSQNEFDQHLQQLTAGIITAPRERQAAVPEPLNAICLKALAIDAADRYPSALALAQDIERWLADEPVNVLPDPVRVQIGRALRKRPRAAAATTATLLMVLIAGILGSVILGQKNRQLSSNNQLLTKAISSSELANRQTLSALRSLVDDVVISKFGEQSILSLSERKFLDSVLVQYQAYAGLQDDSVESLAMRAEGLMQSGRIHLRLSDEVRALESLRAASELLQELLIETDGAVHRLQLARTLTDMSEALMRTGKLDDAEKIADRGILLFRQDRATGPNDADTDPRAALATLHLVQGRIRTRRNIWSEARNSFKTAEQLLNALLAEDAENAEYRQSLSSVFRALSVTWGRLGNVDRQFEYSQRTMELQESLAEQFPDDPEYQLGLIQTISNDSVLREFQGQISVAIEELSRGIAIGVTTVDRFPVVARYREALAGLYMRRGNLHQKHDEPTLAANDLQQAVVVFRTLVQEFPESSEFLVRLQETLYLLASQKGRTSRVKEADALFLELFTAEKRMQEKFPEIARQSTIRARAQVAYSPVLSRLAKTYEAHDLLLDAIQNLEATAATDESGFAGLGLINAHIAMAMNLENVLAISLAQEHLETAAGIARTMARDHESNFELLSQLAARHEGLTAAFDVLKLDDQSIAQHELELGLRRKIVAGFPDNPFYRVELVRAHARHGFESVRSRQFTSAEKSIADATTVLKEAERDFPNEPLLLKTQGAIDRTLGSLLYNTGRYPEAMIPLDTAAERHPCADHLAARVRCMAYVRPTEVLSEVERIMAGEIPNGAPLKNLIFGTGIAAQVVKDEELSIRLGDAVIRLVRHMVSEDYFPQTGTIRELLEQKRFSKLRKRKDFMELLRKLDQRDRSLAAPLVYFWGKNVYPYLRQAAADRSWENLQSFGCTGKVLHGILYTFMPRPANNPPAPAEVTAPDQ